MLLIAKNISSFLILKFILGNIEMKNYYKILLCF